MDFLCSTKPVLPFNPFSLSTHKLSCRQSQNYLQGKDKYPVLRLCYILFSVGLFLFCYQNMSLFHLFLSTDFLKQFNIFNCPFVRKPMPLKKPGGIVMFWKQISPMKFSFLFAAAENLWRDCGRMMSQSYLWSAQVLPLLSALSRDE